MNEKNAKNARRRMIIRKGIFLSIGIAITVICSIFAEELLGENSWFITWSSIEGLHPTISRIILFGPYILHAVKVITYFTLGLYIVNFILSKALKHNNKQITIYKMLKSLLKYTIAIIEILFILNICGVDTTTLVASAGVLTLIIGLGAQSLIADIIAGISIVFDNQFEVGDMVVIDDFRGVVDEIGIRTTKIVDWKGHVKNINNSKINSVLNESKNDTYAICYIDVDYDENILEVEKVIKENISPISLKIPEIIGTIEYKGVSELKDSGIELMIIAGCKTEDLYTVQRALNKEFMVLFNNYNITIPFNQITISNRDGKARS